MSDVPPAYRLHLACLQDYVERLKEEMEARGIENAAIWEAMDEIAAQSNTGAIVVRQIHELAEAKRA